ncbi:hypothetical protein GCM10023192_66700 [Amycolatopsis samaneae]
MHGAAATHDREGVLAEADVLGVVRQGTLELERVPGGLVEQYERLVVSSVLLMKPALITTRTLPRFDVRAAAA